MLFRNDLLLRNLKLLLFLLLLIPIACKEDPPVVPPVEPPLVKDTLAVNITDITHRSVTVNISTTANNPGSTVRLYRLFNSNAMILSEFPITVRDTSIIDDNGGQGLQLDTGYEYYAVRIDSLGEKKDSSNNVSARTLAPTSHEYTWEEFIIGEFQSSLYDVWGTDENNVYAAGPVRLNGKTYGVLHYNGTEWTPIDSAGGTVIYGFSTDDIWTAHGGVFHFDGIKWQQIDGYSFNNQGFPLDSILYYNTPYTSLWGTSSNNLYFGSEKGKIIHWDGKKAKELHDFGVYITDIYGTDENNIWITGEKPSQNNALIAVYNGNSFELIDYYPQYKFPLNTIFPLNRKEVYLGGNGVFWKNNNLWEIENVDGNKGTLYKIRGTGSNNIFAVGAFSVVHHFNGVDWRFYDELYTPSQAIHQSVFPIGNKVFVVGRNNDFTKAKILIGTRN